MSARNFIRNTSNQSIRFKNELKSLTNYFSGLGQVSLRPGVEGESERLVITGAQGSARSHCVSSMAYFRTVARACTGREVHARETRCQCWGDRACEFELAWEQVERPAAVGE